MCWYEPGYFTIDWFASFVLLHILDNDRKCVRDSILPISHC